MSNKPPITKSAMDPPATTASEPSVPRTYEGTAHIEGSLTGYFLSFPVKQHAYMGEREGWLAWQMIVKG